MKVEKFEASNRERFQKRKLSRGASSSSGQRAKEFQTKSVHSSCDAPKPGGPLTTCQPAEYSLMSGYPTPLTKIGQSLLCTGSSTQGTTCPNNQQ